METLALTGRRRPKSNVRPHHRYDTCGGIRALIKKKKNKRSGEIPGGGRGDGSPEAWGALGGAGTQTCRFGFFCFKQGLNTCSHGDIRRDEEWFDFPQTPSSSSSRHIRRVSASTVRPGCDRASLYQSRAEPFVSATAPHVIAQLRTAARLSRARLEKKRKRKRIKKIFPLRAE